jgi:hypothetical protein
MLDSESIKKLLGGDKSLFEEITIYKKEIRKIYPSEMETELESDAEYNGNFTPFV